MLGGVSAARALGRGAFVALAVAGLAAAKAVSEEATLLWSEWSALVLLLAGAALASRRSASQAQKAHDAPAWRSLPQPRVCSKRPAAPEAATPWWRCLCCGGRHDSDDQVAAAAQLLNGLREEEVHPKFCGLRAGPERGELPSVATFAPEPLAALAHEGVDPAGWADLYKWRSEGERGQCEKLRQALADTEGPKDTMTLLRVLRARQGDLSRAAAMYRNIVAWQAETGLERAFRDGLVDESLHRLFDDSWKAIGLLGRDLDGSPVYWERIGATHSESLAKVEPDFISRHEIYTMTRVKQALEELSAAEGRPHMYMTAVIDIEGASLQHITRAAIRMYQRAIRVGEDYYPEMVKRVIMIRTPWIFDSIWRIVKHFFDEGTRDKIQILGSRDAAKSLSPYIDEKWVPKALGGKLDIGSSDYCCPLISPVRPVPESLLLHIGKGRWKG